MAKEKHASWNRTRDCTAAKKSHVGFRKEDVAFCKHNVELMPAVAQAARQAVASCQQLFSDMRWNCSSVLLAPTFTNDLVKGQLEYRLCLFDSKGQGLKVERRRGFNSPCNV